MDDAKSLEDTAAAFRREFDASFTRPHSPRSADTLNFLTLRLGGEPYALSLADIHGLSTLPKLVPLPSVRHGCLGLVGIRGALVPVFDLASLLGYPEHDERRRWIALHGLQTPLAFGFSAFEQYVRVPISAVHPDAPGSSRRQYTNGLLVTEAGTRAVIDASLLADTIRHTTPSRSIDP